MTGTTRLVPRSIISHCRRHCSSMAPGPQFRQQYVSRPGSFGPLSCQLPRPLSYPTVPRHCFTSSSGGGSSSTTDTNALMEDIILTNACVKRVKALQARSGKKHLKLRLAVEGGGCSGFQYSFTMDEEPLSEDDRLFEREGAQVVVDEGALEFVKGATVDFVEDMMKSAFAVVNNPQSEAACGCGSSFAVKNFQKNPAID